MASRTWKCALAVALFAVAALIPVAAQAPDCAVRVDREVRCGGIDYDQGYEPANAMVTEVCQATCLSDIRVRFRINNGGQQPLTNCTLVDTNDLVSPPVVIGDLSVGQSVQNLFFDTTCTPEQDDKEPGRLTATCDCIDSEGFEMTVSAEDTAGIQCTGGSCEGGPVCGDGILETVEECDDGNLVDGDGCSAICEFEPVCGDGVAEGSEECDDGNLVDGDGCAADCTNEVICGDGELEAGEECDDGNNIDGDGCDATCMNEPFCGDDMIDPGEQCDDGNNVDGDGCSFDCVIEPFCGDGMVDPGEECDDANNEDGDGCSADCKVEIMGDQGCAKGFWKNNKEKWEVYAPEDLVGNIFPATNTAWPDLAVLTLRDALHIRSCDIVEEMAVAQRLLRQAVAALLNASHSGVLYEYSESDVISRTDAALASGVKRDMRRTRNDWVNGNNEGCPLDDNRCN